MDRSLNWNTPTVANRDVHQKIYKKKRIANSVYPDEMAPYETAYLDLPCLNGHLFWLAELNEFIILIE